MAAALFVMMCGAAYAANTFGIRKHFEHLFASAETEMQAGDVQTLENIYETAVKDETDAGGETGVNSFMPPVTSNGTTMTPTAAIYEGNRYYLALDITAPEGTVLQRPSDDYTIDYSKHGKPELGTKVEHDVYSYWQIFGDTFEDMALVTDSDGELVGLVESVMFSNETGDNKLTVILSICLSDVESQTAVFGDGLEKNLTIKGLWLQSPDKVYTKVLEGNWTFDLEAYGVSGEIPE
jgi:hypothetical protein